MRLPNLVRVSVGMLLLTLLSGCTPSDASAPPEPTSTFVAPYATDEEALAAAEAAYAEYSRVSDQVLNEGGAQPERLTATTTGDFLDDSLGGLREFEAAGYRSTGSATNSSFVLQRYSPGAGPIEIIVIYLCNDVSAVEILDGSGNSVVNSERDDLATMQVSFTFDEAQETLLIADQQLWESGTC